MKKKMMLMALLLVFAAGSVAAANVDNCDVASCDIAHNSTAIHDIDNKTVSSADNGSDVDLSTFYNVDIRDSVRGNSATFNVIVEDNHMVGLYKDVSLAAIVDGEKIPMELLTVDSLSDLNAKGSTLHLDNLAPGEHTAIFEFTVFHAPVVPHAHTDVHVFKIPKTFNIEA